MGEKTFCRAHREIHDTGRHWSSCGWTFCRTQGIHPQHSRRSVTQEIWHVNAVSDKSTEKSVLFLCISHDSAEILLHRGSIFFPQHDKHCRFFRYLVDKSAVCVYTIMQCGTAYGTAYGKCNTARHTEKMVKHTANAIQQSIWQRWFRHTAKIFPFTFSRRRHRMDGGEEYLWSIILFWHVPLRLHKE